MRSTVVIFICALFIASCDWSQENALLKDEFNSDAVFFLAPQENELSEDKLDQVGNFPTQLDNSNAAKTKAYVKPFAGQVSSYSGFFEVNKEYKSNLFFWLVESERSSRKTDDVILWLQGGPGLSSLLAAFAETGPYELVNGKVQLKDDSWTQYYNTLFLDNPVGAGYSYTKNKNGYHKRVGDAVADIRKALLKFYDMFPEYKTNNLYIAGEDFGGKYIPPLAQLIHEENEKLAKDKFKIPLKGIIIGGAPLDPENQFSFADNFYQTGILDNRGRESVRDKQSQVHNAIKSNDHVLAKSHRQSIEDEVVSAGYNPPISMLDSKFNVSTYEELKKFLKKKDVRKQLHASNTQFKDGKTVVENFKNDLYSSVKDNLSAVLNTNKYKVLLYTGQCDLVIPSTHMDLLIEKLSWGGLNEFKETERNEFKLGNEVAGYIKQYTYLTQIMVRKANHLISRSQPKWTLALILYFTD